MTMDGIPYDLTEKQVYKVGQQVAAALVSLSRCGAFIFLFGFNFEVTGSQRRRNPGLHPLTLSDCTGKLTLPKIMHAIFTEETKLQRIMFPVAPVSKDPGPPYFFFKCGAINT